MQHKINMKKIHNKNYRLKTKKGFSLIELMVAMTIFTIVVIMAIGAFLVVTDASKKAKSLRIAMDNVNFAMENMSRSLRLGSNYYCSSSPVSGLPTNSLATSDCLDGKNAIIFTSYNAPEKGDQAFQLVNNNGLGIVQKVSSAGSLDLTSPEVNITDLRFFVRGSSPSDNYQPSVFIIMKGEVLVGGKVNNFAVQTLASQRNVE